MSEESSETRFYPEELSKLVQAMGRELWVFPCNMDKEPTVKWSDQHTHVKAIPDPITTPVYAVPCKGNQLVVIDIDTPDERRQKVIGQHFPETFTVKSGRDGGGFHLYYWDNEGSIKNDVDAKHERGFDVKSGSGTSGGYVIAPGSWHKAGGRPYRVVKDLKIVTITEAQIERVKLFAERLRFEGEGRNESLNAHLFTLRTQEGYDDEELEREARQYNEEYFIPPLPEQELLSVLRSVLQLEAKTKGSSANDVSVYNDFITDTPPIIQHGESYYLWVGTHWQYVKFADIAMRVQRYVYSREDILNAYQRKNLNALISNVTSLVRRHSKEIHTVDPFSKLTQKMRYINLSNGCWKFQPGQCPQWVERTEENVERLQSFYLDHCLPFSYDESERDSPVFDRYIKDLAGQISGAEASKKELKKTQEFLLEIMAYAIVPMRPAPYFLLMYGNQGTGKSTFPKIICEIVGENAYIQRSMKHVIDGRFAMSDFLGKLVYVDDDLPESMVIPGDFIKTVAGESIAMVERKGKDSFAARLSVFPILLSNTRPNNTGAEGLSRRAIVIDLSSSFPGDPDLYLLDRITGAVDGSTDERSAIFNQLLSAWKRLSERGFAFDPPAAARAMKSDWVAEGDTISAWATEYSDEDLALRPDDWLWQSGPVLYTIYKNWAQEVGHRPMNRSNFYARLKSLGYEYKRINDRGRGYVGPWNGFVMQFANTNAFEDM